VGDRAPFQASEIDAFSISADIKFSIEIRSVADLKIKNFEIVNISTNHIDFI
jgi:hypothetical protein